jgi:hypothetical protein
MARTGKTAKPKPTAVRLRPARPPKVVINPTHLTEDEADYLYYLKHKDEKTFPLDEVMRHVGFKKVER